jgi:hypothetical protein
MRAFTTLVGCPRDRAEPQKSAKPAESGALLAVDALFEPLASLQVSTLDHDVLDREWAGELDEDRQQLRDP